MCYDTLTTTSYIKPIVENEEPPVPKPDAHTPRPHRKGNVTVARQLRYGFTTEPFCDGCLGSSNLHSEECKTRFQRLIERYEMPQIPQIHIPDDIDKNLSELTKKLCVHIAT